MFSVVPREWLRISFACLAMALCDGCATNDLSNGTVPPGHDSGPLPTVPVTMTATLRPTFQWTAPNEPDVSYDLIICAATLERHGFWIPGKTAYFRGGIKTTTHTIDQPLLPNTMYVWSVRTRSGSKISRWAAYSDSNPNLFRKGKRQYNVLCPFKTPEK